MGYIEENLMPGEQIYYKTKLHWIIYKWMLLCLFFSIVSILGGEETRVALGLWLPLLIMTGLSAFINVITSEFGITNKRVLMKTGFIQRNSTELFLQKIEGVQVNQSILGRILNYGTITLSGTGGMKNRFKYIENPLEFRSKANEQIDKPVLDQRNVDEKSPVKPERSGGPPNVYQLD